MHELAVPVSRRDHVRGADDATLTLVEYADFQCPACIGRHAALRRLEDHLAGSLRLVFRHFPLSELHQYALLGATAAEAAGMQGRFWEMHDLLFEHPDRLSQDGIFELATILQLDLEAFQGDLQSPDVLTRIRRDVRGGLRSGVEGTPTFFLNGLEYQAPLDQITPEPLAPW